MSQGAYNYCVASLTCLDSGHQVIKCDSKDASLKVPELTGGSLTPEQISLGITAKQVCESQKTDFLHSVHDFHHIGKSRSSYQVCCYTENCNDLGADQVIVITILIRLIPESSTAEFPTPQKYQSTYLN